MNFKINLPLRKKYGKLCLLTATLATITISQEILNATNLRLNNCIQIAIDILLAILITAYIWQSYKIEKERLSFEKISFKNESCIARGKIYDHI